MLDIYFDAILVLEQRCLLRWNKSKQNFTKSKCYMNHLLGDHRGNYPGLVLNKNWSLSLSHPIQNVGLEWIFTAEGQEWTRSIEKGEVSLGNYEQRMEISLNVFCKCWRAAWKIPKSTNRTLFAKTTDVANKTISCRDLEWCTWLKYSMFEASWAGELSLLKLFCWEGARLSVKLFACVTFQVRWIKCESWFEVKHLYYWRVQI